MPDAYAQVGQGGRAPGRKRNTSNSMSTDRNLYGNRPTLSASTSSAFSGGGLPGLDPGMVANYYGQVQTLQSQLAQQLSMLRSQRVGLRGDAQVARKDAQATGISSMSENINASVERGMLGSSSDLTGRTQVRAETSGAIADVNRGLFQSLAENRIAGSQAALSVQQGIQQIEGQALAARMQLQQQEYANQLQMQIAQMQVAAQDRSTAAQMAASRAELAAARDQAAATRRMANNPYAQYVGTPYYAMLVNAGLAPRINSQPGYGSARTSSREG